MKKDYSTVQEISVSYKPTFKLSEMPKLISSKEVYDFLRTIWDEDTIQYSESFYVVHLNQGNRMIGVQRVSSGGLTGTVADPRIIFGTAVKIGTINMIIAHNHPSGNLKPSEADKEMTLKIKNGGKLFDMKLLDHLIISSEGYFSFNDEGLM